MRKGKYRKAVFIVAYVKSKDKIFYLLLKRKLHWKGWEFPKGGKGKFEFSKTAVKREAEEETGLIPLKIKKYNFRGQYNYKKKFKDRPEIIGQKFILYSAQIPKKKITLDKNEHSDYKWVDFKTAIKKLTWSNQRESLRIVNGHLNRS